MYLWRGAVTLQLFDTTADFWYFGFSPVYHPTPLPVSAALTGYFPEIFVDPPPIFKHFSKFHDFYITHIMKLYSYILLQYCIAYIRPLFLCRDCITTLCRDCITTRQYDKTLADVLQHRYEIRQIILLKLKPLKNSCRVWITVLSYWNNASRQPLFLPLLYPDIN